MARLTRLALLAAACLAAAPLSAQVPLPSQAPVVLLPGDSLAITVWRSEELTDRLVIGADSALTHPLYQEVKIGGIPYSVARVRLQQFLARFVDQPQFTLEPKQRVLISGDMVASDFFRFGPEVTVSQALLIAGAVPERLPEYNLYMGRGGQQYTIPLNEHPEVLALEVRSGDQFVLKQRSTPRTIFNRTLSVLGTVSSLVTMYTFFTNTLF